MKNLIRVSKVKDLPFEKSTLYKWHHIQRFPQLFIKLSGALFLDLDRLAELIESSRGRPVR